MEKFICVYVKVNNKTEQAIIKKFCQSKRIDGNWSFTDFMDNRAYKFDDSIDGNFQCRYGNVTVPQGVNTISVAEFIRDYDNISIGKKATTTNKRRILL